MDSFSILIKSVISFGRYVNCHSSWENICYCAFARRQDIDGWHDTC